MVWGWSGFDLRRLVRGHRCFGNLDAQDATLHTRRVANTPPPAFQGGALSPHAAACRRRARSERRFVLSLPCKYTILKYTQKRGNGDLDAPAEAVDPLVHENDYTDALLLLVCGNFRVLLCSKFGVFATCRGV